MTRRERMEARLERRQTWAAGAREQAAARFDAVKTVADRIPFGQPILVGHHSEGKARRDADRIHGGMAKAVEATQRAENHESRAKNIERQLARAVFSDDPDAIEQLQKKIAKEEAQRERMKAANGAIRKHAKAGEAAQLTALAALGFGDEVARDLLKPDFAGRVGFPGYALTNLGASIRRMQARVDAIRDAAEDREEA